MISLLQAELAIIGASNDGLFDWIPLEEIKKYGETSVIPDDKAYFPAEIPLIEKEEEKE